MWNAKHQQFGKKDLWRTDQVLKSNMINGYSASNTFELGDVDPKYETPASKCVVPNPPCPQAVSSQGQPSESRKALVERAALVLANKSFSKVKQDESCGHLWPLNFFDLRSLSLWKLGKCPLKQCSLDISVDTYLHDHACMMYVICHVYNTTVYYGRTHNLPEFFHKIGHPTVEIHKSYIESRMSHHHHMERTRASTLSFISCSWFRAQQRKGTTPKTKGS